MLCGSTQRDRCRSSPQADRFLDLVDRWIGETGWRRLPIGEQDEHCRELEPFGVVPGEDLDRGLSRERLPTPDALGRDLRVPEGSVDRMGVLISWHEHSAVIPWETLFLSQTAEFFRQNGLPRFPTGQGESERPAPTAPLSVERRFGSGGGVRHSVPIRADSSRDLGRTAMTGAQGETHDLAPGAGVQSITTFQLLHDELPAEAAQVDRLFLVTDEHEATGIEAQRLQQPDGDRTQVLHFVDHDHLIATDLGIVADTVERELAKLLMEEQIFGSKSIGQGLVQHPDRLTLDALQWQASTSTVGSEILVQARQTAPDDDLSHFVQEVFGGDPAQAGSELPIALRVRTQRALECLDASRLHPWTGLQVTQHITLGDIRAQLGYEGIQRLDFSAEAGLWRETRADHLTSELGERPRVGDEEEARISIVDL